MQKNLSLNQIARDIVRNREDKESAERQIEALKAKKLTLILENADTGLFPRNKSAYTIGPLRRVLADAIYEILTEERPLHRQTILNRAVAKGIVFTAKKPISHVSQILTCDPRFERARNQYGFRNGFWTLAENRRNGLTGPIILNQEEQIQNEDAEGLQPSATSNQEEGEFQMVTTNRTTTSQAENGKNPKVKSPALVTALGPDDPDDGDTGRQQRGIAIAATVPIKKTKLGYSVISQSGKGKYVVNIDDEDDPYCSCPDFELRNAPCKHIVAVELFTMRDEDLSEAPAVDTIATKKTYTRNWATYNAAQEKETVMVDKLLHELCATIPEPPQGVGRPRLPLADMVLAVALKVYSTLSTRRAMPEVEAARKEGRLDKTPSFPTIIRYLAKPELTPILEDLIERSAIPLQGIEVDFAADSSGFSTTVYERWHDHKWGRPVRTARFIKGHVSCGVRTNIITCAVVTPDASSDARQLPKLVKTTAKNFAIRDFSADKAYLSRENLRVIEEAGGTGLIPFKVNSVAHSGHHKRDALWEKAYLYFHLHREEFLARYHQRSNVETTFHMVKSKFGHSVRAKTPVAQVNEVLVKFLLHNLAVVAKAMVELGIEPNFSTGEEPDDRDLAMAA